MNNIIAQRAQLTGNKPSAWVPEFDLFLTYVRTLQFMKLRLRETGDHEKMVHIPQKEIESRFFIYPKHDRKTALQYLVESGELEIKECTSTGGRKMFLYGAAKQGNIDLSMIEQPKPPDEPLFQFMANCLNDVSLRPGATSTPYFDLFLKNKESFLYHFFKVDNFSGRVHTPVTNLHRTIRPDLLLTGKSTASFDVATMQPLLLGKILLNEIGENEYSKWINQGVDIYVKLQEAAKLSTRDEAKKRFFEILFSPPTNELLQMFGASDWIKWINNYKGRQLPENPHNKEKRYSNLAWLLQTTEVKLMRKVWNLLFFYKIPFLSIHDEIIIKESDGTKAEGLFHSVLKNEFEFYQLNRKTENQFSNELQTSLNRDTTENVENWNNDILKLEIYFNSIDLPPDPIKINSYSTILDCRKFVESNLATAKNYNGISTFLPYLNRLHELKNYFDNI